MPIPLPDFDDRRWADLVEEARGLIPQFAPGWTDHNASDPGITLVELLSWLTEREVYRVNRVPDARRRKFLGRMMSSPRGATPARGVLGLNPPAGASLETPEGAEFLGISRSGLLVRTTCARAPTAFGTTLQAVMVQDPGVALPRDLTRDWRQGRPLLALGDDPRPGSALWLGFDTAWPSGQAVGIFLHFEGDRHDADERRRIRDEIETAELERAEQRLGATPSVSKLQSPSVLVHHDARVVWEYLGASGWAACDAVDETRALTLDGHVSLSLPQPSVATEFAGRGLLHWVRARLDSGDLDAPVTLSALVVNPIDLVQSVPEIGVIAISPVANVPATLPPMPALARIRPTFDPDGAIANLELTTDADVPEIRLLGYVPPDPGKLTQGLLITDLVLLGQGHGGPSESFAIGPAFVEAEGAEILTLQPPDLSQGQPLPTWDAWTIQADLDASTPRDRHAFLDESSGTLVFGDGRRGRVVPAGSAVFARFSTTIGGAGDLARGSIAGLAPSLRNWLVFQPELASPGDPPAALDVRPILSGNLDQAWTKLRPSAFAAQDGRFHDATRPLIQPWAFSTGADPETIDGAAARAVADLATPYRAITVDDYRALAAETPGTRVARLMVCPGLHPSFPRWPAPGVVTVVVVPAQGRRMPFPSTGLLRSVKGYLCRRKLVGTQLEVAGPTYLVVSVTATVQAVRGARIAQVVSDVRAALDRFLDPLHGGPAAIVATADVVVPVGSGAFTTPLGLGPSGTSTGLPPQPAVTPFPPAEPGWPFGRDVYRSEVLQVIDGVAGVDHVLSLELSGDGAPPQCGNLCVGPIQLVSPGVHAIVVVSS